MAITELIAAIELGSSKISGIAGKKNEDGTIQVLAYTKADSTEYIKKGVVYNLDQTSQAIKNIVEELESILKSKIAKVYVGIGGQSVRTSKNIINRTLGETVVISQQLVDSVCDENIELPLLKNRTILEVSPQEFKIGNDYLINPVGVASDHLEGHFMNIVARESLKSSLIHSFELAKLEIADLLVSPVAAANLLIPDADKKQGCAFIDFGAQTTTVVIYKNNLLRFLTVIPLGGANITRDLTSLKIDLDRAEALKLELADLNYKENEEEELETHYLDKEKTHSVPLQEINNIVKARAEEIVANVWNQIQLSGFHDELLAGLIITGGGSNLTGLKDLIKKTTRINKVKYGTPNQELIHSKFIKELKEQEAPNSMNTLLGLLAMGDMNCAKIDKPTVGTLFEGDKVIEEQEKSPEEIQKSLLREKQAREEKLRKEKEAEERKKAEEERKKKKKKSGFLQASMRKIEEFQKNLFNDENQITKD